MVDALFAPERLLSLVGVLVILGVAILFSNNRSMIRWRLVVSALVIQIFLGIIILKTGLGQAFFASIASVFEVLYQFAGHGSSFVFGALANTDGPWGMIFAVKVLPTLIFFGAFTSLLYHVGVVQFFVSGLSTVIRPILGTSGAETLAVAANVMLGQTEAPLLIKNYLPRMTESEMLVVMVGGMSHLSGSLLAVYGGMGVPISHLLTSSFMAIPAAIMIAKILIPETEVPETLGGRPMNMPRESKNILDAVSRGTTDGLSLAVNVGAMLISFISLMAFLDFVLGWATGQFLATPITLDFLFGKLFYGVAYLLGIPMQDCSTAGSLLGQKLVINEFVAYMSFAKADLLPRSKVLLTYALAGFSNFSCIGIQIGGIGAICPEKRTLLTKLGIRALLGGTLANFLNAAIVGILL